MGRDPEAIIYYGWPIDRPSSGESTFDLTDEWNSTWKRETGPPTPADKPDYKTAEWDAWRKQLQGWEASAGFVEVDWSGADDCETYYIFAGPRLTVEWDEQQSLAGHDFGRQPERDKYLRLFCERFGLDIQEAGWHLAARYF